MSPHDLDALHILRDALDTDPGDRDRFLSERCGADTALRERVQSLLRGIAAEELASVAAAGFECEEAEWGNDRATDALVGTRLGPYRVVERVGRGGMGIVYRGVREGADFAQQVAIKLIRRGYDFDDIRARFIRERRILARLSHPNLARFIDGGVAADGRPWFALEFVDGKPITAWCDARRLDIRSRIRLFLDVCAAVQYAHTQLVVHRDLKPGNVLVNEAGTVRLLDFGVAGLLSGDGDDESNPSTIGMRQALTPEYAAPEQFAGSAVGVSADVYSLGVVAYELISGVLPYDIDRQDLAAVERIVREVPPHSLTGAIAHAANAPARSGVAANDVAADRLKRRGETRRSYRGRVRGDLARIVEKALAKEPARRYTTVESFASDLARWLDGATVRVSGNGLAYRIGKFTRRNRLVVAVAIGALLSIAGLSVFHVTSLRHQLEQTTAQRERAQASLGFLQRLLASPDPQTLFGPKTNLGEFLSASYAALKQSASVDSDIRDEIGVTVAASLRGVEDYDKALDLLHGIVANPDDSPVGWRTQVAALTEVGQIETLQGKYEASLRTLGEAASVAERHAVRDPLVVANLLSNQSVAHNHLAQWDASIALIDRAVEVAKPISESEPLFYANLLGFASIPRGYPKTDLPGAEQWLRRSLAFQERHGLTSSGMYPDTKGELAQVLIDQGHFEDAEPILLDVVGLMKQRYGPDNRETAFKDSNLALLYMRWNRLEQARLWRDEATRAMTSSLGPTHPFVALSWYQSADLAFLSGAAHVAARDARRSVAIADAGDKADFLAKAELYEAHARCMAGDESGIASLQKRLTELGDAFGSGAFYVRIAVAECLNRAGRHAEAVAAIRPFANDLERGKAIPRNDYFVPVMQYVREGTPLGIRGNH